MNVVQAATRLVMVWFVIVQGKNEQTAKANCKSLLSTLCKPFVVAISVFH